MMRWVLIFGGDLLQMNPYDYGYIVEVKVLNEQGAHSVTKHYAMGRLAFELGYVLPDKKTAYMSDDGTNVGLYMFVADREMDLSSGTLYVARWEQVSSENGGAC
jgi:secreted PhoX family phosphatase